MRKGKVIVLLMLIVVGMSAFEGTYETDRYGYCEMIVDHNPDGYYIIEWNLGTPGNVYFGAGISAFDYLAVAELDSDEIGIFGGNDGELDGIWASIDRKEIHSESTEGAEELVLSDRDISGVYEVTGENDLGQETFEFVMSIMPYEPVWQITLDIPDEPTRYGVGLLVDDVLVAGFSEDDIKLVFLLSADEGELYGDWMMYRYEEDYEVKTGILEAIEVKAEG